MAIRKQDYLTKRILLIPLVMGVMFYTSYLFAATDSTTATTYLPTSTKNINVPGQVSTFGLQAQPISYPSTTTMPSSGSGMYQMSPLDAVNASYYPPCPGDPSTWYAPANPICPSVMGTISTDPTVNPYSFFYTTATQNDLYFWGLFAAWAGSYTNIDLLCPDFCTTTRYSTPAPVVPVTTPQPVTTFTSASCPNGYVEVYDYNTEPAIQFIVNPQTLMGPFTTAQQAELTAYEASSTYRCGVDLVGFNQTIDITTSVEPANAPYNNHSSINTTPIQNDGSPTTYCSGQVGNGSDCVIGGDSPPTPGVDYQNIGGSNYIGQWIAAWTWTPFWDNVFGQFGGNVAGCSILGAQKSFAITDNNCDGSGGHTPNISSGTWHKDLYWHYYRYERCQYAQASGWYYTSQVVSVSHICARLKPGWQKTN